jgi:hypothetical protein
MPCCWTPSWPNARAAPLPEKVQRCTISADPLLADRLLRGLNDSLRAPRSGPNDALAGSPPRVRLVKV